MNKQQELAFNLGRKQVMFVYQNPFNFPLSGFYWKGIIQGRIDRISRLMRNLRFRQHMAKIEYK